MKPVLIVGVLLGLRSSLETADVCYLISRKKNVNFFPDTYFGKDDNLIFIQCPPQIINMLDQCFELIGLSSKQLKFREVFCLGFIDSVDACNESLPLKSGCQLDEI